MTRLTAFRCVASRTGFVKLYKKVTDINSRKILVDLFKAYYTARKNKRKTKSSLSFEINYEKNLLELGEKIMNGTYTIGQSICFISFKPLQREIFAADFRDRIVHHFIYNYVSPVFERSFINDSYSCRIGRGTSYGVKRLNHFIRSCSKNYHSDCYILKLDIKGYFMSIDKNILYKKVEAKILDFKGKCGFDKVWLLELVHKIIFHDPTKNCVIKGKRTDWQGLPKSKSLFFAGEKKGLPIGNLTSQLFGNVYLDDFDHFVRYGLGCGYYGRYVDDMVIVHNDKEYLKSVIPKIREYLKNELELELHPKKIYLQHYSKGVVFLGTIIKPYRMYVCHRTKSNFNDKIQRWNKFIGNTERHLGGFAGGHVMKIDKRSLEHFLTGTNSYLGVFKHCNTYKMRRKMLTISLSKLTQKYFYFSAGYDKINIRL